MALYLAYKEIIRNRGRFLLFSLVIALITTLVLFIAALADGLAVANKEFIDKLDAEILIFQRNVELSATTSRISFSLLNDIDRIPGIQAGGPIGLSNAALVFGDGRENLNVSLIGVEAGKPGDPTVISGTRLVIDRGSDVVVDENVAKRAGVKIGEKITVKSIQGSKEEFYNLSVIGITEGRQYLFQPSIFLPYQTWDKIKPQAGSTSPLVETTSNIVAVKVEPGYNEENIRNQILASVRDVEVSDKQTAIESLPGFSAQQSTLNTQQGFTLLIGILVIGGFFQIQMLQKVPLVGVMKAIGTSNSTVGLSVVLQIVMITCLGVLIGSLATLFLALGIPDTIPIKFDGMNVLLAILTLIAIGPIGGLVSVHRAVTVEPLIALGLSS